MRLDAAEWAAGDKIVYCLITLTGVQVTSQIPPSSLSRAPALGSFAPTGHANTP